MLDRADPKPRLSDFAVASIVCLALLIWIRPLTARLDPLTGDEPFYVMTAFSLVRDGDLDEQNNYEQRDYDEFYPAIGPTSRGWAAYPDPLPPHATAAERSGLYSKHGLGLALLIALPWEIGGRALTLTMLSVIASLVALNMSLLARQQGASPVWAAAIALALALTNPLFAFSLLIFPEMTAALGIVYAVRRLLTPRNSTWQWALVGCCAAALPWLHYRLAPISVAFALMAVARFRRRNSRADWLAAALPPLASGGALGIWFIGLYGSPLPPSSDHAGFSSVGGTLNGLMGTLFDQQWGAVVHNPILALAIAAMAPLAVTRRSDALTIAAVALPYLGLVAAYRVWWGEWNPPGRYVVDIVPLAAAPLGWLAGAVRPRVGAWAMLLCAAPAGAVMLTFVADPQRMYNHPDGRSRLLETWSSWSRFDLTTLAPSFVFYSESSLADRAIFAALGVAAIAFMSAALGWLRFRDARSDGA